jgi:hypothetical protein
MLESEALPLDGPVTARITAVSFTVLVPARLASTRLPDKPLADIGGLPMVVRVAERAALSGAAQVVVACDNPRIQAGLCRPWRGGRADPPRPRQRQRPPGRSLPVAGPGPTTNASSTCRVTNP